MNNYRNNIKSNEQPYLRYALRKYGLDNFLIEIIDICENQTEMDNKEKFYIKNCESFNPKYGYNLTLGGQTNEKGYKKKTTEERRQQIILSNKNWSPELKYQALQTRIRNGFLYPDNLAKHKNKMSNLVYEYNITNIETCETFIIKELDIFCKNNNMNKVKANESCRNNKIYKNKWKITRIKIKNKKDIIHNEETKNKISAKRKGHIVSEETRKKISLSNIGRKHSLESLEKMSMSQKGRKLSENRKLQIQNALCKFQYTITSPTGEIFITKNLNKFC
jgi:hypothetical protein